MNDVMLLDCTLRDGGYVNDWRFGRDNIVSIFERVVDAGVDIIEIGFLDERRPFDPDRSIMPDTDCVEKIYGGLEIALARKCKQAFVSLAESQFSVKSVVIPEFFIKRVRGLLCNFASDKVSNVRSL